MKNKLVDLQNHLFAQMERLNDEQLSADKLVIEAQRTASMVSVAREIIANGKLALDAQIALGDHRIDRAPSLLTLEHDPALKS